MDLSEVSRLRRIIAAEDAQAEEEMFTEEDPERNEAVNRAREEAESAEEEAERNLPMDTEILRQIEPIHQELLLPPVIAVACGESHTVAIEENGRLIAWGRNQYGQLGLGGASPHLYFPHLVEGDLQHVRLVACGYNHTFAVTQTNRVYAWGDNRNGELGLGHRENQSLPRLVIGLNFEIITSIAAGWSHSAAVTREGRVFAWGSHDRGQLGLGVLDTEVIRTPRLLELEDIAQVSCGYAHTAAVARSGRLYTWGLNDFGQLGLGHTTPQIVLPCVPRFYNNGMPVMVACGNNFTATLHPNGRIMTCGRNTQGQLGLGHYINQHTFATVPHLTGIVSIACGGYFMIALHGSGRVFAWGENNNGQLGPDFGEGRYHTPREIAGLPRIIHISCGLAHVMAITWDNQLLTWGRNQFQELGLRSHAGRLSRPTMVGDWIDVDRQLVFN